MTRRSGTQSLITTASALLVLVSYLSSCGGGVNLPNSIKLLLSIVTGTLPNAAAGNKYSATLAATGGSPPYNWSIASGTLPTGLTLSTSGTISGTPTTAGTSNLAVQVADSSSNVASKNMTLTVTSGGGSPSIASVSPSSGSTTGGTGVTISGSNFLSGAGVTFGGTAASGVTVASSTQIQATVPAHAAGAVDVTVTNPGGLSATLHNGFTYVTGGLTVALASLPEGNPQVPYHATLIAANGAGALTWSIASGGLPTGLGLSSTGVIEGTPTQAGKFSFTVQVTDSSVPPQTATTSLNINIESPPLGPAALPQVFIDTTFPDTTGYTVTTVAAGADLQGAINATSCSPNGTILRLASGATYNPPVTSPYSFTLPAKTCAAGQWIIIRTDTADSNLPAPGARVTPSYSSVLAKIQSNDTAQGAPAILTNSNANHYWFMGVEMSTPPTNANTIYDIFRIGAAETSASQLPNHIVVDRCYVHGNSTGVVRRGVTANGAYVAVINSWIENIHDCVLSGGCVKPGGADTQAISAWSTTGPIKIANDYLSASGENVLFGGADPQITNQNVSDIEIRQNYFSKPTSWWPNSPDYAGIHWLVKNILESKNVNRELVDGNVFSHNWADAQDGTAILYTPRNQGGSCNLCMAQNITFRYNILQHSANGFNIAGSDDVHPSLESAYIYIHDNLVEDINSSWSGGGGGHGYLHLVATVPSTTGQTSPHDVTIDHNTEFSDVGIVTTGPSNTSNPWLDDNNFTITNNVFPHATYGINGTSRPEGNPTLQAYWTNYTITENIIEGAPIQQSNYPAGNFWPSDWSTVFVNYAGGDYHILATSTYHNAGTDGEDLGADMDAVIAATAGVTP